MLSKIRRHLSYANVAATLALVFAMSGAALAANQVLITSTNQISHKVLKKLKGNSGAKGAKGATGATGTAGAAGAAGAKGETGERGPSHAYSNFAAGTGEELVTYVSVPAGKYVINGSGEAQVESSQSAPGLVYCKVLAGGTAFDETLATVPNTGGEILSSKFGLVVVANQATVTLTSPTSIGEECEEDAVSTARVTVRQVTVTAIQVGGLN
jgi:hypothetical protein